MIPLPSPKMARNSTRPNWSLNVLLHGNVLGGIAVFIEPQQLLEIQTVCKHWNSHINVMDEVWKEKCSKLWHLKQNHPLERWVLLPRETIFQTQPMSAHVFDTSPLKYDYCDEALVNLDRINTLAVEMRLSCENLQDLKQRLGHCQDVQELQLLRRRYKVTNIMACLIKEELGKLLVQRKFHICRHLWLPLTHLSTRRIAAPLSRALITLWSATENEIGQEPSLLKEIRRLKKEEVMVHLVRNAKDHQVKSDALEAYRLLMEKEGRLLSWKDSFFASIRDSRRTSPTYEELRELGDFVLRVNTGFNSTFSQVRFVNGGRFLLTNGIFQNTPGRVALSNNVLSLPDMSREAIIRRVEADWGWHIIGCQGFNEFCSVDKVLGRCWIFSEDVELMRTGALSAIADSNPEGDTDESPCGVSSLSMSKLRFKDLTMPPIGALRSQLLQIPMYGIYVV